MPRSRIPAAPPSHGMVWHFAYVDACAEEPEYFIRIRDGFGFGEMQSLLVSDGWRYMAVIPNPAANPNHPPEDDEDADLRARLVAGHLLLCVGRPPLHDHEAGCRKKVRRSLLGIERRLHAALGQFLASCARDHIELTDLAARKLRPGYEDRACTTYGQYRRRSAQVLRWASSEQEVRASYLIYVPQVWQDGPAALVVFSPSAIDTAAFTSKLRWTYPDLVAAIVRSDQPWFVMAELQPPPGPHDPRAFDDWDLQFITELTPLEMPAPSRRTERTRR